MKRERFEAEAAKMRARNSLPPAQKSALEKEEAFRIGYVAGTENREACPLRDPILRRRWKDGFGLGAGKGLKITLPKPVLYSK
jgi:ribosome modulation factor